MATERSKSDPGDNSATLRVRPYCTSGWPGVGEIKRTRAGESVGTVISVTEWEHVAIPAVLCTARAYCPETMVED